MDINSTKERFRIHESNWEIKNNSVEVSQRLGLVS